MFVQQVWGNAATISGRKNTKIVRKDNNDSWLPQFLLFSFLFLLSSKEKRPFVVLNFKDGSEGVSYKHACTLFTIANRKTGHQNKRRLIVVEMFLNPWQRKALTEWENRFADTRLLVGLPFLAPASTCILSLAETLFKMYNLPRTSICCNPPKKNKTKQDKTLPGDLLSLGSNTPLSK